ncbi:hypothetical protein A3D80_00810 [Candidatus Roizmanbacteria bacterium RIFCSPHIGHO2_02_FULL_40_13b]|nr:MAG: hypothetical protein A3D80_00810 [Candidatus Roizmanbacteria bacterium RIFCSPHIGHO2_02_FULL_40_13b]
MDDRKMILKYQMVPLVLTVVIFFFLSFWIFVHTSILNSFSTHKILLELQLADILVGATIYLKTSVDFAIFIGGAMSRFPGVRNRIAIEAGTAFGNATGTVVILTIWNFFRDIQWLLALMIFIASLVLLRMAQDGFEHAGSTRFARILSHFNKLVAPFLNKIIPHTSMNSQAKKLSFRGLFAFSFTVPFILGLDDFAGYVPLFNVVHVFGFAIGVLFGHMVLNLLLFISPTKTIALVKNKTIAFIGAVAFVILALWGMWEVVHLFI